MTPEELIAQARKYAKMFERGKGVKIPVDELPRTRVTEAVVVCFGADDRDDYIEVTLASASGAFMGATYHPATKSTGGTG